MNSKPDLSARHYMGRLMPAAFMVSLLLLFMAGCDHNSDLVDPVVCTAQFKWISVTVVNSEGEAEDSVTLIVNNLDTGVTLDLSDINNASNGLTDLGIYAVFHDGFKQDIGDRIQHLQVIGTKQNRSFAADFQVSSDVCHVFKVSGPDTVVLR